MSERTTSDRSRPTARKASSKTKTKKATTSKVALDDAVADDNDELASEEATERRTVERRRQIDPTTCERDYGLEEIEFMNAMDDYKRRSGRQFPTWSEVLEVLRDLGYRKVAEPTQTYTGEE